MTGPKRRILEPLGVVWVSDSSMAESAALLYT